MGHLWLYLCKELMRNCRQMTIFFLMSIMKEERCLTRVKEVAHRFHTTIRLKTLLFFFLKAYWKACHLFCVFNNSKPLVKTFWPFIRTDDVFGEAHFPIVNPPQFQTVYIYIHIYLYMLARVSHSNMGFTMLSRLVTLTHTNQYTYTRT